MTRPRRGDQPLRRRALNTRSHCLREADGRAAPEIPLAEASSPPPLRFYAETSGSPTRAKGGAGLAARLPPYRVGAGGDPGRRGLSSTMNVAWTTRSRSLPRCVPIVRYPPCRAKRQLSSMYASIRGPGFAVLPGGVFPCRRSWAGRAPGEAGLAARCVAARPRRFPAAASRWSPCAGPRFPPVIADRAARVDPAASGAGCRERRRLASWVVFLQLPRAGWRRLSSP